MQIITTITMEAVDRDYLQYLYFEHTSYKEVLSYILLEKMKGYEFSKDNYEHFMNEFKEAKMKYDMVVLEFVDKYAPEFYGNSNYLVDYNFEDCEMIIYKREEE